MRTYSDRSLQNGNTLVRSMSRDDVPVNAPPFFRKPLDEACSVADLTSAFRQRLALLRRHDRGEILLIGHDQFEPLTQDDRTRLAASIARQQGGIRELNGASRFRWTDVCTEPIRRQSPSIRRCVVFPICLHPLATIRKRCAAVAIFRLSVDSHARLPIFFGCCWQAARHAPAFRR